MKLKKIQHYSQTTDKGSSVTERVIRTVRNLLEKTVSETGNADWLSELRSVIRRYNNSINISTKMTSILASRKSNEKEVYSILRDERKKQKPKFKLGKLVRTAAIERVFSKGDSTKYSYNLYKITEVLHNTLPTYGLNCLTERYIDNLLLPTKLILDESIQVMKKLNLIQ